MQSGNVWEFGPAASRVARVIGVGLLALVSLAAAPRAQQTFGSGCYDVSLDLSDTSTGHIGSSIYVLVYNGEELQQPMIGYLNSGPPLMTPISLASVLLPNCFLWVDPQASLEFTPTGPAFTEIEIQIPCDPSLRGTVLGFQAMLGHPSYPGAAGYVPTNGASVTIQ